MTFDCMTPDELAAWTEAADAYRRQAGQGPMIPCWDCPVEFRAAALAAGTCDRMLPKAPPPRDGLTSEERVARTRVIKRDWMRASRARVRATCDNGHGSSSAQSHRLPNDARVSATTRGAGVVVPLEVVAR